MTFTKHSSLSLMRSILRSMRHIEIDGFNRKIHRCDPTRTQLQFARLSAVHTRLLVPFDIARYVQRAKAVP